MVPSLPELVPVAAGIRNIAKVTATDFPSVSCTRPNAIDKLATNDRRKRNRGARPNSEQSRDSRFPFELPPLVLRVKMYLRIHTVVGCLRSASLYPVTRRGEMTFI